MWSDVKETCRDLFQGLSSREKFVWGVFCFTCVQVAFLFPYVMLLPGERSNLFSGLLCILTLGAAWFLMPRGTVIRTSTEVAITAVLAVLVILSGIFSETPLSSSARGWVVLTSGIGGFWTARILLVSQRARRFLRMLCLAILAGLIVASFAGYLWKGQIYLLVDSNPHPVADRMLILWFAPLSLLLSGKSYYRMLGASLIFLSYLVFYASDLRSAMLIPVALIVIAGFFGLVRLRWLVPIFVLVATVLALFFHKLPAVKMDKFSEPTYYRAECYPFALHVALKRPLLGIGLRAPKERYLDDYRITYPYVTKEKFAYSLKNITTLENTFLTFMAELGFPFLIIYLSCLTVLLIRLVRRLRGPPPQGLFHPMVLFLPIVGALLHFQVLDGLLHPQISWFFHMLLGMIPAGSPAGDHTT